MKKLFFALLAVFLIFCCSKDEQFLLNEDSPISHRGVRSNQEQNHTFDVHPDTLIQTVSGEEMNNPFAVENLQRALLSLCNDYDSTSIDIRTTDKLIKF